MSQSNNWGRLLAFSSIVTCMAFALSASGQGGKTGPTFAVVDFSKISTQFKANDQFQNEFKGMQAKFDARLQRRNDMPFLTEEEQKSLDMLTEKAAKTDADTAKIKEIETKNRTKNDEIQAIRQKADKDLTDGDKKKLEETEKYFREAQGRLAAMKEDLTAQITQFGKTQTDELMKRFRVSVTKVAEQKGIAIVFSNEVALYAGTDITDTVLNDLNKK